MIEQATRFLSMPRMGAKERASFAKRLSFLVRSGMPIPEAIELIDSQTAGKAVQEALHALAEDVRSGRAFSDSASEYPGLFSSFSLQVIRVGETSGSLSEGLAYLAGELQKKALLRGKLVGSLVYPALITTATLVLTISLILFVFPKILPIFSGLGTELPLSTRFLLAVHGYLRRWGLLTLLFLLSASTALAVIARRSRTARARLDRFALAIPILGPLLIVYHVGNISRALALLLKSGMTLRDAVPAAALATPHASYRAELELLSPHLEQGSDMALFLRERRALFPAFAVHMIAVGESSGALAESLAYVSEFCEGELEEQTKRLGTLVEPALMIVMGGIVGFVAVSMIAPIYEITQHLHAS